MTTLSFTLACADYDRVRALVTRAVQPDGIDLAVQLMPADQAVWRMVQSQDFEVSEMTLGTYCILAARGKAPYVAIPVFLSRAFRHGNVFVHRDAAIDRPEDLNGKRIGAGQYQMTAAVWIRGLLMERHGLRPETVDWHLGRTEVDLYLPREFRLQVIPRTTTLNDMLARGEIDALFAPWIHPQLWQASAAGDNSAGSAPVPASDAAESAASPGAVRRLWPDFKVREQAYFRETGIFPIMHTVVIRRDVLDRAPWVATSLYRAFCAAKRQAVEALNQTSSPRTTLPWLAAEVEETRRLMGEDFWPYGLEPNRKPLETFLDYLRQQHLVPEALGPEQLFAAVGEPG